MPKQEHLSFSEREHIFPVEDVEIMSSQGSGRIMICAKQSFLKQFGTLDPEFRLIGDYEIVIRPRT